MKIETKYDIGQEVWFNWLEPVKAIIIAVTKRKYSLEYRVETINRGCNDFVTFLTESKIFPTKEELIKSL